jgi:hypothetical protein
MCSISREPRRDEYTIRAAVAPDAVFIVCAYREARPHDGPGLVRNTSDRER